VVGKIHIVAADYLSILATAHPSSFLRSRTDDKRGEQKQIFVDGPIVVRKALFKTQVSGSRVWNSWLGSVLSFSRPERSASSSFAFSSFLLRVALRP